MKLTWEKPLYQSVRTESKPRRFFITQRTHDGRKTTKLFRYDDSLAGYSLVSYCCDIRKAKELAEEEGERSTRKGHRQLKH